MTDDEFEGREDLDLAEGEYYWISAVADNGKLIILGAYDDEEKARTIGLTKLGGRPFEVVGLKYKDPARATKILKYRRLQKTGNLQKAIDRASHKV